MAAILNLARCLTRRMQRAAGSIPGRFVKNDRGNIAVIFGITAVPLMSLMGAAVDYTQASTLRTRLQAMQDMAVLSAISKMKAQVSASQAQTDAIAFFNAQTAAKGIQASISLTVSDVGNKRSVTSTFSSTMATNFMKIAGFPQMTVSNTSKGELTLPSYIDFYLLLDNTPSMGLGATPADISLLQKNAPEQCAFACHETERSVDNYRIAKNIGATLRIDVVRQATQKLTDTATQTATMPNQFRMGVYTFGSSCPAPNTTNILTTISPLTSNMTSVKSAANGIDLMSIPYNNYNNDQCTDFDGIFAQMNNVIPNSGTGTQANPQKYLFYVSDGLADARYPTTCSRSLVSGSSTRCIEALKPADCSALKARGVTIAVLYTTYLALDTIVVDSPSRAYLDTIDWYKRETKPAVQDIATNMKACASPDFYFEVSPSQGISAAMDALFRKAISKARLTG